MSLLVDGLLAAGLLWLALQVVRSATLFRSIVLFIVFGLVMALGWARLEAPDLALAEAAIGAGVTGALLLVTYRRLALADPRKRTRAFHRTSRLAAPVGALAFVLVLAVGLAALRAPTGDATAGILARAALPGVGVANPVTGVLLAFRAYDTLLEMVVLLVAYLGARAVAHAEPLALHESEHTALPLVGTLLAAVVPLCVLVAGHLLHAGGRAPGGAFQAGAVLAAGGVLLALAGRLAPAPAPGLAQRVGLTAGILVFSGLGLAMLLRGQPMLALPGVWAVYLVETALMVSIALTLVLLFVGSGGLRRP
jgi:multisubunit Na+/H+ antiporter MnhB subunit